MDGAQSIQRFFHCMGLVAVFSALNTNLTNLNVIDILRNISMTFAFNLIVGIPGGLSWMFGMDLYLYIKKSSIK